MFRRDLKEYLIYPWKSNKNFRECSIILFHFEESLKIYYFFKQIASREKKKFELHQIPGFLKITCWIQILRVDVNLFAQISWRTWELVDSGSERPIPWVRLQSSHLTNRSRVSCCCRRCHKMSQKNSPASQGWGSCGSGSVMSAAVFSSGSSFCLWNANTQMMTDGAGEKWFF